MVIMKYRAKRDNVKGQPKVVYVLSTWHRAAMKNTDRMDKDGNALQKKSSIIDYLVEQCLDSLDISRKSYKWHKKFIF